MKQQNAGTLTGILKIKTELLTMLLNKTTGLKAFIENEDIEGFGREMAACEQLMGRIDEVGEMEQKLASRKSEDEETAQLYSNIAYILNRIAETTRECTNAAQEKSESLSSRIKAVRQTKQGISGYAKQVRNAVFIDARQ